MRAHHAVVRLRTSLLLLGLLGLGLPLASAPSATAAIPSPAIPKTMSRQQAVWWASLVGSAPPGVVTRDVGTVRVTRTFTTAPHAICPGIRFNAFVLAWTQDGPGRLTASVRTGAAADRLGAPAALQDDTPEDGPDPGSADAHPRRRSSDLLWAGNAGCVRFTLTLPAGSTLSDLRAVFIDTMGNATGGPSVATVPVAKPVAQATPGTPTPQPSIITRAGWGADESLKNCFAGYSNGVQIAFAHHTASSNTYAKSDSAGIVRAIYYQHTVLNGWCDIAYSFLVDKYGQIFEGRWGGISKPVIPAATMGFNTGSTAVSAIGNYQTAAPSSALLASMKSLLAWRMDQSHTPATGTVSMYSYGGDSNRFAAGTWVKLNRISGHRDGNYTDCPGDDLYNQLGSIRTSVSSMGLPKIYSPVQSQLSFAPGRSTVTWSAAGSASLSWDLQVLDSHSALMAEWKTSGASTTATWDGTSGGLAVATGLYTVTLTGAAGSALATPVQWTVSVVSPPNPQAGVAPSATDSGTGIPGQGQNDLVEQDASGGIEDIPWTSGLGWGSPVDLGGVFASAPAAASDSPGQLRVFALGTDGNLYWDTRTNKGVWSGWISLGGGGFTSRPAAVSWGPNRVDLFIRGPSGSLLHRWLNTATWSNWEDLGGILAAGTGPSVASMGSNKLEVFVQATNGALDVKTYAPWKWSGWGTLGGIMIGEAGAASPTTDEVDVFVRGTDNRISYRVLTTSWTNWKGLEGNLIAGPAAASPIDGDLAVDALVSGGTLQERRFHQGIWSAWAPLP